MFARIILFSILHIFFISLFLIKCREVFHPTLLRSHEFLNWKLLNILWCSRPKLLLPLNFVREAIFTTVLNGSCRLPSTTFQTTKGWDLIMA
jgi:hypothetical protein